MLPLDESRLPLDYGALYLHDWGMSTAPQDVFRKDAWQNPRNARTLRVYMALRNQEIAERVTALRKGRHMSQKSVYEALGVSERAYQNWESGDTKPNYTSLQKLAEFFQVTEGFILEGVDDRPVIEGVPEQLDGVDEKFSELVARVQTQLDRLEEKLDRLTDLFSPPGEADDRQPAQMPLVAALVEAFQAAQPASEPARTGRGRRSQQTA